jgi:hypothetical protein
LLRGGEEDVGRVVLRAFAPLLEVVGICVDPGVVVLEDRMREGRKGVGGFDVGIVGRV